MDASGMRETKHIICAYGEDGRGRSSSNTSYRKVAMQSRSRRRSGERQDGYQAGHGEGAGNRRRRREPMPSA